MAREAHIIPRMDRRLAIALLAVSINSRFACSGAFKATSSDGGRLREHGDDARMHTSNAEEMAIAGHELDGAVNSGRVILLTTLDGRVTAVDPVDGRDIWSVSTGGPLLQGSSALVKGDTGAASDSSYGSESIIIPSRDGSIMITAPGGGLQRLPYKAQELVNQLPITAGPVLVVGSKTSRVLQVSLATGRILRTISASGPLCPQPDPAAAGGGDDGSSASFADPGPAVWIGRSDYVVTAYDGDGIRQLWNVTYSELVPPEPTNASSSLISSRRTRNINNDGDSQAVVISGDSGQASSLYPTAAQPALPALPSLSVSLLRGEVTALHPSTGELEWRHSGLVQAPVVHAYALQLDRRSCADDSSDEGGDMSCRLISSGATISSVQPLSVTETWPRLAAGAGSWKKRRQLLLPNSSSDASTSYSSIADDEDSPPPMAFVGVLPSGQPYALPYHDDAHATTSSSRTVAWEQVELQEEEEGNEEEGEEASSTSSIPRLLLPAPEDASSPSSSAVVVAGFSGRPISHPQLLPRVIGVHNVTSWIDGRNSSSHNRLRDHRMPSLPPRPVDSGGNRLPASREAVGPWWATASSLQLSVAALVLVFIGAGLTLAAVLVRRNRRRRQEQLQREAEAAARKELKEEETGTSSTTSSETALVPTPAAAPPTAPAPLAYKTIGGVRHRLIGRLAVSDQALGYGCQGTVVYAGWWDGRPVAVKRMLRAFAGPSAAREISLLIRTDGHPNVVRYYACEEEGGEGGGSGDFLYLALERCACSLAEAVETCVREMAKQQQKQQQLEKNATNNNSKKKKGSATTTAFAALPDDEAGFTTVVTGRGSARVSGGLGQVSTGDVAAQAPLPPPPSPVIRAFLRQVVLGLAPLHANRILHRDIKPHNILLAEPQQQQKGSASYSDDGSKTTTVDTNSSLLSRFYPSGLAGGSEGARLWSFVPKISDFGLSKQLPAAPGEASSSSASAVGSHLAAAATGRASSSSALLRRLAPGLRQLLLGSQAAGNDDVASTSSTSAVTPGSTGWTAPEVVQAAIDRHRSGGGSSSHQLSGIPEDGDETGSSEAEEVVKSGGAVTTAVSAAAPTTPFFSFSSDVWSLGAVLYHVLDPGRHPFGEPWEREANLLRRKGQPALGRMVHLPEAHDLLTAMLAPHPSQRPTSALVAEHPFFWRDDERLALLCELSDRLELEATSNSSSSGCGGGGLLAAVEAQAEWVLGPGPAPWSDRLPPALYGGAGDVSGKSFKRYDYRSLGDLLRVVRNKRSHFRELPPAFRADAFGSADAPTSVLLPYLTAPHRFPRLLMAAYAVACGWLAHEQHFASLLGRLTSAKHAPASALRAAKARAAAAAAAPAPSVPTPMSPARHAAAAPQLASPKAVPAVPATNNSNNSSLSTSSSIGLATSSRHWYLGELGWQQSALLTGVKCATATGGPIVPATVDMGGSVTSPPAPHLGMTQGGGTPVVMLVAAHERAVRETSYRGGAHADKSLYKSQLCKDWDASGGAFCPRGVRCDFAHGPLELRLVRFGRPGAGGNNNPAADSNVSAIESIVPLMMSSTSASRSVVR